jgi:NAD(P)-dependent dehydrogenase (short-subunit alcohol dehydrogenase family)
MSTIDLSEELIVLSGAAGGLGRVISHRLAEHGATVVAVDIVDAPAPDLAENRRANAGVVWPYRADVSSEDEVGELLADVHRRYGRHPSTVCCHAGMVQSHGILDYPADALDELFRVNVRTAFVLAQQAARRWVNAGVGGHLIFTSSWVDDYPWPEIAPYCASKAALHSLMRSFAKELASAGIRANSVRPGIGSAGDRARKAAGAGERRRRIRVPVQPARLIHDGQHFDRRRRVRPPWGGITTRSADQILCSSLTCRLATIPGRFCALTPAR